MSNIPQFAPEGSIDPSEIKEYCSKSLFEQLQEQKNLKNKKFEEENSFKNDIKIYDEDDIAFVNEVRQSKLLKELEHANEVKLLVEMAKKKEAERLANSKTSYETIEEKFNLMRSSKCEDERLTRLKTILKRKREEEQGGSESKVGKVDQSEAEIATTEVDPVNCLPGMEAYIDSEDDTKSDSDSSDSSTSSDIDVGTLRPLIKRLNDKIKKNC